MPNHIHLILAPGDSEGLGHALGQTHWRYAGFINARLRVTGHLFQSRFGSVVMDEEYLMAAARYVALNPVRARIVEQVGDWPWSSARAHLAGRDDGVVSVAPLLDRIGDFAAFLDAGDDEAAVMAIRRSRSTSRRPM